MFFEEDHLWRGKLGCHGNSNRFTCPLEQWRSSRSCICLYLPSIMPTLLDGVPINLIGVRKYWLPRLFLFKPFLSSVCACWARKWLIPTAMSKLVVDRFGRSDTSEILVFTHKPYFYFLLAGKTWVSWPTLPQRLIIAASSCRRVMKQMTTLPKKKWWRKNKRKCPLRMSSKNPADLLRFMSPCMFHCCEE